MSKTPLHAKKKRSKKKAAGKRSKSSVVPRLASPMPAASADGSVFVIMLDDLLRVHPHHFPITAQAPAIDQLRAISQHSGQFTLITRSMASAELLENKDLIFAPSGGGRIDEGGIYRLTSR